MKVKLTRKMLCAVLSLVMVLTSLPLTVFATTESEKSEIANAAVDLFDAIEKYEISMNGTIYNSGMSAAYSAYTAAYKVYDKACNYKYNKDSGEFDIQVTKKDVDDAKKLLIQKTNEMTESGAWQPTIEYQDNVYFPHNENGVYHAEWPIANDTFSNILYMPSVSLESVAVESSQSNTTVKIFYPDTVVVYDGSENTPKVPIFATGARDSDKTRYIYAIYPCAGEGSSNYIKNSTEVSLPGYWHGDDGGENLDHSWSWGSTKYTPAYSVYTGSAEAGIQTVAHRSRNLAEYNGVANYMLINAVPNNEYKIDIKPWWYISTGDAANSSKDSRSAQSNSTIYVLNFKKYREEVLDNASKKLSIGITDTYAAGGLKNVIEDFEAAVAFNINKKFNETQGTTEAKVDAVVGVKEGIEGGMDDVLSGINAGEKVADPVEYANLRKAINDARERYDAHIINEDDPDNPENPTTEFQNWDGFKTVYEAAVDAMLAGADNKYTNTASAESAAKALNEFQLLPSKNRVDTNILQYAINNAQFVIDRKEFFNFNIQDLNDDDSKTWRFGENANNNKDEAVKKIKEVIDAAKIAVWGAVENYPHIDKALYDEPGSDLIVLSQVGKVSNIIRDLEIDFDAVVSYAVVNELGEQPQSLNSAINDVFPTYQKNSSQYANFILLSDAVSYGERFKNAENNVANLFDPGRQNSAQNLVTTYCEIVFSITDAINDLYGTFSYRTNGAVIYKPTDMADNTALAKTNWLLYANGLGRRTEAQHYFEYVYPNKNPVFIRTTTDQVALQLDDARLTWYVGGNSQLNAAAENYLDTVNFDVAAPRTTDTKNYGKDETYSEFKDTSNPTYKGSLSAAVTGDRSSTGNFKISDIRGTSTSDNINYFGIDNSGAQNGSFSKTWDEELETVNGNREGAVVNSVNSNSGAFPTRMTAKQELNLNAKNAPSNDAGFKDIYDKGTAAVTETFTKTGNLGFFANLNAYALSYNSLTTGNGKTNSSWWALSSTDQYTQTVKVVDTSNLTALVDYLDANVNSADYTTSSLAKFNEKIIAAEAPLVPTDEDKPNSESEDDLITWISNSINNRYKDLWEAYKALEPRATNFVDTTTDRGTVEEGYDSMKYELFVDVSESKYSYESMSNLAKFINDFTAGSEAANKIDASSAENYKSSLLNALNSLGLDEVYGTPSHPEKTVAMQLRDIILVNYPYVDANDCFKGFKYVSLDDTAKLDIPKSENKAVINEGLILQDLVYNDKQDDNVLLPSSSNEYMEKIEEARSLNADDVNTEEVNKLIQTTLTQEAVVINGTPYYTFNYRAAITAIETAINDANEYRYEYTVKVNTADGKVKYLKATPSSDGHGYTDFELVESDSDTEATKFHYGDIVQVTNEGGSVDWYCTVKAHTTDTVQKPKYLLTAESYTFNVRGDTELYISDKTNDKDYFKIKFINNMYVQNTVAFDYAENGQPYPLADAPVQNRMFYQIDQYYVVEDGVMTGTHYDPSATPTFTKDTTLLVTYKPIESEKTGDYQIIMYRHDNDSEDAAQNVKYNQLTTVNYADPAYDNKVLRLIDKNTGKILSYTNSYTFYACDNLDVKPIVANTIDTYVDTDGDSNFDVSVISKPVLSNKRAQIVGSFAKPSSSSATIVGAGIVLNASGTPVASNGLTLADVNGKNNILNLSVPVSKIMNTNQFAVSIGYSSLSVKDISYVSYVIYETVPGDSSTRHTVYSNVMTGTLD